MLCTAQGVDALSGLFALQRPRRGSIGIGAENDRVVISLAGEGTRAVVESVAISPRASSLEDGGIEGGATGRWVSKFPAAAILI